MENTNGKLCIKVEEVGAALNISRRIAYELVHRDDFPKIRIGRRILVPVAGLEEWVKAQAGGYEKGKSVVK